MSLTESLLGGVKKEAGKEENRGFWSTMISPQNDVEKSKRFWTTAGGVQWGALLFAGGPGAPMGASAGLTAYAGFEALRKLAESENDTIGRQFARESIRLMFGIEGENNQFRRRAIDVTASIAMAALFGGATVSGMIAGLATGACLTLVTTWQKGAEAEWFKEGSLFDTLFRKPVLFKPAKNMA